MYGSKPGAYPGPRATPTVDGDLVFTLSRHGDLLCLDAKDGQARWQKNVRADFGVKTEPNGWGLSCSPLVLGERLVLDFGKVLVLDKQSGALAFSMGEEKPAFSSPIAFVAAGKSHVTSFNTFGLVLHDLDNRKEVGRYAWEPKFAANALTPVVSEDKLFISAGYGKGCALLRLTPQGIEAVYENTNLSSECSSAVLYKGFLYGESGEQGQKGTLKCLDFATGKVRWEQGGYRVGGGLIVADGKIVHMRDRGELVVAEATPDAYRELARARVLDGTCWTLPVLANGRIYCRNIKGSLICLDVRSAP
jgi:outer membrane protein assembly factor BamB